MHFWLAKQLTVNPENKNLRVLQISFRREENATTKQLCTIFALIFKRQEHKETEKWEVAFQVFIHHFSQPIGRKDSWTSVQQHLHSTNLAGPDVFWQKE